MTRPAVTVEGNKHMTQTERRTLIEVIKFLRTEDPATYGKIWAGPKRSPKKYCVEPDPVIPGRYSVGIRSPYRNDYGQRREQIAYFTVRVSGIEPLPLPAQATKHATDTQTPELMQ